MTTRDILKPYERRREPGRFQRLLLGLALILMAGFYGLMCSILPMQALVYMAAPILIATGLIIWLLPDVGGLQDEFMSKAMLWFVALNAIWPVYVAISTPGMPWISGTRIAIFALMAVGLMNFATSAEMRQEISAAMGAVPLVQKSFWVFWATSLAVLPIAYNPLFSITKFANNQIYWTAMFAFAAWLGTRRGFAERIGRTLAWTIIVVALIAINEYRVSSVIWLPYMPSWLIADDGAMEVLSRFNGRAGTDEYRVRGTFSGALYFAEYLALTFPFVLHALVMAKTPWKFLVLALALVAVMTAMFVTSSRSAAMAVVLTPMIYGFMASWRVRKQRPSSLTASAVLFAYPLLATVVALLVVFWRRLHVMIIGGGQHQGSTDARTTQWAMGWPKILSHPFGHGGGNSGEVLGFFNGGSETPTVDSYVLTLLLDYGFIGMAAFVVMLVAAIWMGFQAYNRAVDDDQLMLAPMTIALFNFAIIKLVSSTEGSMSIMFIIMGCMIGIVAQQQRAGLVPGYVPGAAKWRPPARGAIPA